MTRGCKHKLGAGGGGRYKHSNCSTLNSAACLSGFKEPEGILWPGKFREIQVKDEEASNSIYKDCPNLWPTVEHYA